SKETYEGADEWKNFTHIQDDIVSSVEAIISNDPVISAQYYNLLGAKVLHPQQGRIYTVKKSHQSGNQLIRKLIY
ncbi:hypothetical protein, partial [Viscerimonas tarda]